MTGPLDLFSQPDTPHHDGWTYDPGRDHKRLARQMERVRSIMSDGAWHTLSELADKCQGSEAGISARLRDLRKAKFGGYTVTAKRLGKGLWAYRMQ